VPRSRTASSRPALRALVIRLAATLVGVAAVTGAIWLGVRAAPGLGRWVDVAGLVAVGLLVILIGLVAAALFVFRWPAPLSGEPTTEEPWLPAPQLPAGRGHPRVLSICGLAPGAGSSTIALNLGLHVACQGVIDVGGRRRPRALVLLQDGDLSRWLRLDPQPLRAYFEAHPVSADDSIVDLASRHPAGCEVLCLGAGLLHGHRLRLLVDAVRDHYDLVVIDCPTADPWLTEAAGRLASFTLLVGGPGSESAALAAAEAAWSRGAEGRVGLLLNRVPGTFGLPEWVSAAFVHWALLPEDPVVASADEAAQPWVLRLESRARRALSDLARCLMPDLLPEETANAA